MNGPLCYSQGSPPIDGSILARTRGYYPGALGFDPPPCGPPDDASKRNQTSAAKAEDAVKNRKSLPPKAAATSPLLTAGVVIITPEILGEFVSTKGVDVPTVVSNLNKTVKFAKITTALAEAMLIAQMVEETGGFIKAATVENGVDSIVVYNPSPTVPAVSKQPTPIAGTDKKTHKGKLERYLHGKQVTAWRLSKAKYEKDKAAFAIAQPGQNFDAPGGWPIKVLTDYVPGDLDLTYWKLWYDPTSPNLHRAAMAKKMGNVYPGDGLTYIGRGYIQLTWRGNYAAAGKFLNLDLENKVDLAAQPDNAVKITAWFWNRAGCNRKASADTPAAFKAVIKAVNGGAVNITRRQDSFTKIKASFLKHINTAPVPAPK